MRAMRKLLLFSQSLFLFSWGVMMSNGAGATNAPSKMVILGASYAGGWGQPALPGYEIVNRGAGGEETSQMRARFERDVLTQQPSVVLIW